VKKILACALALAAVLAVADGAMAQCTSFDVVADFQTVTGNGMASNPGSHADIFSCPTPVWKFMASTGATPLVRNPATYVELPSFRMDQFPPPYGPGVPGLEGWCRFDSSFWGSWDAPLNTMAPYILKNATGADANVFAAQVLWPTDKLLVHPTMVGMGVIAFQAPESRTYSVSAAFQPIDTCCGSDGVIVYIDRGTATKVVKNLKTLTLPVTVAGFYDANVALTAGQFLYFVIHPNAQHVADGTLVSIAIQ